MRYLLIYAVGVAIGLAVMRDRWVTRIATALLWPLGPLAFLVVISILLVAAAILWPVPVVGTAAVVASLLWLLA